MAEPVKIEARLYWSQRSEEGKVKLAKGFEKWAQENPGNWIHAMDAIQDWISELTEIHNSLFAEWEDVSARWRAKQAASDD